MAARIMVVLPHPDSPTRPDSLTRVELEADSLDRM